MGHFEIASRLFMSSPVHTIAPNQSLESTRDIRENNRISSLAVVDNGSLVGVVSRTDLLRIARREAGTRLHAENLTFPDKSIDSIMHADVSTIDVDDSVRSAAQAMVKGGFHRVFVTENDSLKGVLSTRDLMTVVRDKGVVTPISEHMSAPLFTVRASEPISLATDRLEKAHISGLIVVDDNDGWPIGLFTQREALTTGELPRETHTEEVMNTAFICMPQRTPIHRAAAQARSLNARRVIAIKQHEAVGILTGLDFARCIAR